MICDALKRIDAYKGLSGNLDAAIDFLARTNLNGLEEGRIEIMGDQIYAAVSAYESKEPSDAQFEAHRRYIDIQIIVEGEERIYWLPMDGLSEEAEYSSEKDVLLFSREGGSCIDLRPGLFCILFPQDAHKPGCRIKNSGRVRKAVIKVQVEKP